MEIRVIQYDGMHSYEVEIKIGDHWFSFSLNKEQFLSLKDRVNAPEQHSSYGN